jgi:hypothetical protein
MRVVFLSIMAMFVTLLAQEPTKTTDPRLPVRGRARLSITPMPGQIPASLRQLCNTSALIIEGVVDKVLPPRETSPGSLETDAIISVNQTLKGSVALKQLVISQRDGTLGDLDVRPTEYSLVQPGERYLLFVTEDARAKIPAVPGLKRYLISGIWSGLFYFEEGRMLVRADVSDRLREKYEGLTEDQIMKDVMEALQS